MEDNEVFEWLKRVINYLLEVYYTVDWSGRLATPAGSTKRKTQQTARSEGCGLRVCPRKATV